MPPKSRKSERKQQRRQKNPEAEIQRRLRSSLQGVHPDKRIETLNRALQSLGSRYGKKIVSDALHRFLSIEKNWVFVRKLDVMDNVIEHIPEDKKHVFIANVVVNQTMDERKISAASGYNMGMHVIETYGRKGYRYVVKAAEGFHNDSVKAFAEHHERAAANFELLSAGFYYAAEKYGKAAERYESVLNMSIEQKAPADFIESIRTVIRQCGSKGG